MVKFLQFLGNKTEIKDGYEYTYDDEGKLISKEKIIQSQAERIVKPIDELLDVIIVPLLILIGSAGLIYSIVLGVNYSKAENADKREEAKKRLVNTIIGFVILLVLLVLLRVFTNNAEEINDWIHNVIDNANDANKSS